MAYVIYLQTFAYICKQLCNRMPTISTKKMVFIDLYQKISNQSFTLVCPQIEHTMENIYDQTGTRRERFNIEAEILQLSASKVSKICHGRGHFEFL